MGSATAQAAIWAGAAEDWTTLQEPNHRPLWTAMLDALEVGAGTRLLDAACGGGGASLLAKRRGAEVDGIDATPALIEIARRRVPDATFVVGDLEEPPYDDETFDAVLASNALQFCADRVATLRTLARICRPDGRIAVGNFGPREGVAFSEVLDAIAAVQPDGAALAGPLDLSTAGVVEALAAEAGLRVVASGTVDCPFTYPDVETCLRAVLSGGPMQAAIGRVGLETTRAAVRPVAERYRGIGGRVVIGPNRFRYVVLER